MHRLGRDFLGGGFPLHVVEARHGPVASHSHEFFELVYLRAGRGTHWIGDVRYPIQTGDVYVISPGEPHAYHTLDNGEMRIVNLLFLPEILDRVPFAGATLSGLTRLLYIEPLFREEAKFAHRLNLRGAPAYRVATILEEMLREQRVGASGYELVLTSMFCTLLVWLSRAYEQQIMRDGTELEFTRRHAVVTAAVRYIETHHAEPISLSDVAQHTALSTSRLAHLFKEHTQRSLLAYLHEYRVGRVCEELLRTDTSVTALAANMGYGDLRFFHRVFRRQVGCSPMAYRRLFGQATPASEPAAWSPAPAAANL
ncbi:MAG: helix-turn-helix domain-containing protein [Chloroflexota bacterium]